VKRAPQRLFGGQHDLFVSSNTKVIAAVKKVEKMLKKDPYDKILTFMASEMLIFCSNRDANWLGLISVFLGLHLSQFTA
jgi:hypothetical protein